MWLWRGREGGVTRDSGGVRESCAGGGEGGREWGAEKGRRGRQGVEVLSYSASRSGDESKCGHGSGSREQGAGRVR